MGAHRWLIEDTVEPEALFGPNAASVVKVLEQLSTQGSPLDEVGLKVAMTMLVNDLRPLGAKQDSFAAKLRTVRKELRATAAIADQTAQLDAVTAAARSAALEATGGVPHFEPADREEFLILVSATAEWAAVNGSLANPLAPAVRVVAGNAIPFFNENRIFASPNLTRSAPTPAPTEEQQRLSEEEVDRLLHLEELVHRRVVGQNDPVAKIAELVRSARAGLKDPDQPIGSVVMLGPSGVGKTEIAKTFAEALFGSETALVRFDMSEYRQQHQVARFIGSPPGYVGHDKGGQLTKAIAAQPRCVLLLDEIDKAHEDVLDVLLAVLDDGRLTDGQGNTVPFGEVLLLMTANFGSSHKRTGPPLGFTASEDSTDARSQRIGKELRTEARRAWEKQTTNEFRGRIDEVCVLDLLTDKEIEAITNRQLDTVVERVRRQGFDLEVKPAAVEALKNRDRNPLEGARHVRKAIKRLVNPVLTAKLLRPGTATTFVLDARDGELVVHAGRTRAVRRPRPATPRPQANNIRHVA